MATKLFIDIHAHATLFDVPNSLWNALRMPPAALVKRYDELGIERGVLLPIVSPEWMMITQSNEQILEIARRFPKRFIPFCNVDPRALGFTSDAPLGKLLNWYKRLGCRGIGEVTANLAFGDPLVRNLFACAQRARMPLTFHVAPRFGRIYGLVDKPGLPGLERSLMEFPKLKFLAHSQSFWAEIGELETPADQYEYPEYPIHKEGVVPKLFRRYPNLYGDLSANSGYNALARDEEYAIGFLTEFQDRLCFGTDITGPGQKTPLVDFLLRLRDEKKISGTVFRKIARENAEKLLGIRKLAPKRKKKVAR